MPRIIIVPGIGIIAAGRDSWRARAAREAFRHTIRIMAGSSALGGYRSIAEAECREIEFRPLELYRQDMGSRPGELSGRIALVTGAAGGIGRAIAHRLAAAGAHVVIADRDAVGADTVARAIESRFGERRALATAMDVTREEEVRRAFDASVAAYGGIDLVVSNAGIAESGSIESMPLATWTRSLDVNATGHFLVTREALRILRVQGTGGSLVFVATKNVPSPGRDFSAYSAAKAAETQLARVAALEGADVGVRVNIVHPDGIFEGSSLWSDAIRRERAFAHGVPVSEIEDFYRRRNLLKTCVYSEDVAEAVLFLAGPRSSKTTGAALGVDGGVSTAFPR